MQMLNLFFVPVISLAIHCRRSRHWPPSFIYALIFYCIYAVILALLMMLNGRLLSAMEFITDGFISSGLYLAISLVLALLLPLLAEFFAKYFGLWIRIEKND